MMNDEQNELIALLPDPRMRKMMTDYYRLLEKRDGAEEAEKRISGYLASIQREEKANQRTISYAYVPHTNHNLVLLEWVGGEPELLERPILAWQMEAEMEHEAGELPPNPYAAPVVVGDIVEDDCCLYDKQTSLCCSLTLAESPCSKEEFAQRRRKEFEAYQANIFESRP